MSIRTRHWFYAGLICAFTSTEAFSATIEFDLTNPIEDLAVMDTVESVHYSEFGLNLTVRAVTTPGTTNINTPVSTLVSYLGDDGLGESNDEVGDTPYLDGYGDTPTYYAHGADFLAFSFSEDVLLESFSLGFIGSDTDAHVFFHDEQLGGMRRIYPAIDATEGDNSPYNRYNIASDYWLIGAFNPRYNIYGDITPESFSLDSVTVNTEWSLTTSNTQHTSMCLLWAQRKPCLIFF